MDECLPLDSLDATTLQTLLTQERTRRQDLEQEVLRLKAGPARQNEVLASGQARVLLIAAAHAGSIGLRTIIKDSTRLRLVAEIPHGSAATQAVRAYHLDHIVVATDGITDTTIHLLHELRAVRPDVPLIVCSNESDGSELAAVLAVPVEGLLAWADVTSPVVHETRALIERGLSVVSMSVRSALTGAPSAGEEMSQLSATDYMLLRCLEDELTPSEMAKRLHRDQRSLLRLRRKLEGKLDVHSLYKLGKRVQELSLSSDAKMSELDR